MRFWRRSFWLRESPPNSINLSDCYLLLPWCWRPKILQLVQVKIFKISWWPCSQATKWVFFISRAISLQSTRTGSCSEALWLEAAISRHVGGFFFAMRCSRKTTCILSLTLARCSQKDFPGIFHCFLKSNAKRCKKYSLLLFLERMVVILHPCQISTQFIAIYCLVWLLWKQIKTSKSFNIPKIWPKWPAVAGETALAKHKGYSQHTKKASSDSEE